MKPLMNALYLTRPTTGWGDRHLLLALVAALPVWAGLWWAGGMPVPGSGVAMMAFWPLFQRVILSPILEEIGFRGALQSSLLERDWGRWRWGGLSVANGVCSLVFALAHLWAHSPLWAAAVFIPSLVLGHLRERSNSVLPGMVVHCWYNAGFFWLVA